ncbi:hypothetical protein E2C01_029531 [Portunus trituberculatus]|uniref:Uncharacterized protein n=1 Tax=Portunus trituberculatus TaxID=210409 RepID=A0A5B7EUU6_PORTR|nr:hypothetical protein [Portunus trituberculatus]
MESSPKIMMNNPKQHNFTISPPVNRVVGQKGTDAGRREAWEELQVRVSKWRCAVEVVAVAVVKTGEGWENWSEHL